MALIETVQRRLFAAPENTAVGLMQTVGEIDAAVFHAALALEQLQRNAEHADADAIFAASSSIIARLATIAPAIDRLSNLFGVGSRQKLQDAVSALDDGPFERG